jgi:hypothetical protein
MIAKKIKIQFILLLVASIFLATSSTSAQGQYSKGSIGVDVSYPNCNAFIPKVAFGIVGVNYGKPFSQNPCLKQQAGKFNNLSFYVNSAYPGQPFGMRYQNTPTYCSELDFNCLAYNYGYNAAKYSYEHVVSLGLNTATTWWIDVETMNSWIDDTKQNRQSIQGMIDYLKLKGVKTVGIYSTTFQWNLITASWQNGLPGWGATTWRTPKQASTYCKNHEFTGGPSYLMQYLSKSLDYNVAC